MIGWVEEFRVGETRRYGTVHLLLNNNNKKTLPKPCVIVQVSSIWSRELSLSWKLMVLVLGYLRGSTI